MAAAFGSDSRATWRPLSKLDSGLIATFKQDNPQSKEFRLGKGRETLKCILYHRRSRLTKEAEKASVNVFRTNLRQLLLSPPVRGHAVLGIDPGYKHGCKLAAVSPSGKLLKDGVIHPHANPASRSAAADTLRRMVVTYKWVPFLCHMFHICFSDCDGPNLHDSHPFSVWISLQSRPATRIFFPRVFIRERMKRKR